MFRTRNEVKRRLQAGLEVGQKEVPVWNLVPLLPLHSFLPPFRLFSPSVLSLSSSRFSLFLLSSFPVLGFPQTDTVRESAGTLHVSTPIGSGRSPAYTRLLVHPK